MKSFLEKNIKRLSRENEELLETITRICMKLDFPTPENWFSDDSNTKNNSLFLNIKQIQDKIFVQHNSDTIPNLTIAELSSELMKKKEEYQIKMDRIKEYLKNTKIYEEMLQKNEEEKIKILTDYQTNQANISSSGVKNSKTRFNTSLSSNVEKIGPIRQKTSFSSNIPSKQELEMQIQQLIQETSEIKNERDQVRQRLQDAHDKLQESHKKNKDLQEELKHIRSEVSFATSQKEDQLEMLRQKVHNLDIEILKWKNWNKDLMDALSSNVESNNSGSQDAKNFSFLS